MCASLSLGMDPPLPLLCFVESWWLHVHRIGIYGYGYIHGYPRKKSVDMDMDMDGKFHIHGKPGNVWSHQPQNIANLLCWHPKVSVWHGTVQHKFLYASGIFTQVISTTQHVVNQEASRSSLSISTTRKFAKRVKLYRSQNDIVKVIRPLTSYSVVGQRTWSYDVVQPRTTSYDVRNVNAP